MTPARVLGEGVVAMGAPFLAASVAPALGTVVTIVTGVIAVIVWLVRLEGAVKSSVTRGKEQADEITQLREDLNGIAERVSREIRESENRLGSQVTQLYQVILEQATNHLNHRKG